MQKKKLTQRCPMCKTGNMIHSIFGSICTNEDCFYEPKNVLKDTHKTTVTKKPLVFKRGINKIRIPLLPAITVNNVRTIDGKNVADIIADALKHFKPRKNVDIDVIYTVGTRGVSMEVVVSKK